MVPLFLYRYVRLPMCYTRSMFRSISERQFVASFRRRPRRRDSIGSESFDLIRVLGRPARYPEERNRSANLVDCDRKRALVRSWKSSWSGVHLSSLREGERDAVPSSTSHFFPDIPHLARTIGSRPLYTRPATSGNQRRAPSFLCFRSYHGNEKTPA